jgi:sigma-B regulation protein RsbU (phosphoserine phosphatase)
MNPFASKDNVSKSLKTREQLERELQLRETQLSSLLNITQAINENVSSQGLFDMYRYFLSADMDVSKMALFTKNEGSWESVVSFNVEFPLDRPELIDNMLQYKQQHYITQNDSPVLQEFNLIIPVFHKNNAIAYTLIGDWVEPNDHESKTKFITTIANVIAVAIENKRLFKQQIEKERLAKEVELAEEVQQMLIPDSLPSERRFNMASIYQPHFNVGGDYFDYIPLSENRFIVCIADISGKGVAAAILMANFHAVLRLAVRKLKSLREIVIELNKNIYAITQSDKFITFFIGMIDLEAREIQYINAGHNPPMLLENDNLRRLDIGTTVLGAVPYLPEVETGRESYRDHTLLLSYTDGLIDIMNEKGERFEHERIEDFLRLNGHLTAHHFNQRLQEKLESFRNGQEYPDDVAILTCQITPVHKPETRALPVS